MIHFGIPEKPLPIRPFFVSIRRLCAALRRTMVMTHF
jgi:hypothetical protein